MAGFFCSKKAGPFQYFWCRTEIEDYCLRNECIFENKRTLVHPKVFNDEIKKYDTLVSHLPKEPINEFGNRFYNPQAFIYGEKTNMAANPKTYQCKVYQDENLFNQ